LHKSISEFSDNPALIAIFQAPNQVLSFTAQVGGGANRTMRPTAQE
jgi:hypothetical protein